LLLKHIDFFLPKIINQSLQHEATAVYDTQNWGMEEKAITLQQFKTKNTRNEHDRKNAYRMAL